MPTIAPLNLCYKPDAAEAQARMRAYWQGELVDRPCVAIRTPKRGVAPPWRSLVCRGDFDHARSVAEFEAWAECQFFGGESLPVFMPNYGPDQWAGFLGAELTLAPEKDTSWAKPLAERWEDLPPLIFRDDNPWLAAILELTDAAAAVCDGRFILGGIDTHSNLDCLAALRGAERLCVDLLERPEQVSAALAQLDALYEPLLERVSRLGRMDQFGYTSWLEMWADGVTQAVQCDFCCMISRSHFRQFALPWLRREIDRLDRAVYHMDGPGQIRHLDDLLAIENLHTIQWVPGAGQPSAPAWLDMLRKIQRAGKSVQLLVSVDEVKQLHGQLDPARTFYWVLDCSNESQARELLEWLARNT